MTFTEVTKVPCRACSREVAVVRMEERRGRKRVSELRVSRHLLPEIGDGDGFCLGSMREVKLEERGERKAKKPARARS